MNLLVKVISFRYIPQWSGGSQHTRVGLEIRKPQGSAETSQELVAHTTNRWWVGAVGSSPLRGTRTHVCGPDTLWRVVLLAVGSYQGCHWENSKPCTVHYSRLLLLHMGTGNRQEQPEENQEGLESLWTSSKDLWSTAFFSSILLVKGKEFKEISQDSAQQACYPELQAGICLVDHHWIKPWREEKPKKHG